MPIQGGHGRHPTTEVDTIKQTLTANNTWDAWECAEIQRLKVTYPFSKFIVLGCVGGIHKVGVLTVGNLWESVLSLDCERPEDLTVQAWQQASLLAEPSQPHDYHIFMLGFCKV